MIFVTVGTQVHFDRLIRTVDEWAGVRGRSDVFAQIGPSNYRAQHIQTKPFIDPTEFRKRIEFGECSDSPCRHGLNYHRSGTWKAHHSHAAPRAFAGAPQ